MAAFPSVCLNETKKKIFREVNARISCVYFWTGGKKKKSFLLLNTAVLFAKIPNWNGRMRFGVSGL